MCTKLSYSKREAKQALKTIRRLYGTNDNWRNEKRHYFCEPCRSYHLTSQDLRDSA